jgi:hypothetical protein
MLFSCAAVATACAVRSMSPRRAVKVRMICPDLRPSTAPSPPRPKSRGFLFAEQLRQLRDIWPRSAALVLPHEVRKRLQPKRDRVAFLPTCRLATFSGKGDVARQMPRAGGHALPAQERRRAIHVLWSFQAVWPFFRAKKFQAGPAVW